MELIIVCIPHNFAKAVTYNILDSAGNALATVGDAYNEAVNITISGTISYAKAKAIDDATNTDNGGVNSYNINDDLFLAFNFCKLDSVF